MCQVFYAFFKGWRQRYGLPELELNNKQQQLVASENALELHVAGGADDSEQFGAGELGPGLLATTLCRTGQCLGAMRWP